MARPMDRRSRDAEHDGRDRPAAGAADENRDQRPHRRHGGQVEHGREQHDDPHQGTEAWQHAEDQPQETAEDRHGKRQRSDEEVETRNQCVDAHGGRLRLLKIERDPEDPAWQVDVEDPLEDEKATECDRDGHADQRQGSPVAEKQ